MIKLILGLIVIFASVGAAAQSTIEGVGLVLRLDSGLVYVQQVLRGTPAERAGIQNGEIIKAVDGVSVVNVELDTTVMKIRGHAGSLVALTIADAQNLHERVVSVIREVIRVPCFMEGPYSMTLFGPVHPTTINGTIGYQGVHWQIMGSMISGTFGGEPINLTIHGNLNMAAITGSIHGQMVNWYGSHGQFTGFQQCIP